MTDIEQKALALVNEVLGEWGKDVRYSSLGRLGNSTSEALFRAIEQHEATKQKAAEREQQLVEAMQSGIARAEAQHEATKQELSDYKQQVSDALLEYYGGYHNASGEPLERFIIPAPKPDPLVEVLLDMELSKNVEEAPHDARYLRAALDALGFEIREKNDDQ